MLIQKTCGVQQRAGNDRRAVILRDVVRRLVIERSHLGVTSELVRHEARCLGPMASSALAAMTRTGEIWAAKVPGDLTHWFASAELAARWRGRRGKLRRRLRNRCSTRASACRARHACRSLQTHRTRRRCAASSRWCASPNGPTQPTRR